MKHRFHEQTFLKEGKCLLAILKRIRMSCNSTGKRLICGLATAGILLSFCGCGTSGKDAEKDQQPEDYETQTAIALQSESATSINCESVLTALKDGGIPIADSIVYTEDNDPNILNYGVDTELEYEQKANFADERIEPDYKGLEPQSGTIEIFSSPAKAVSRAEALRDSGTDRFSYRIVSDNILVRLSGEYTKEQAQEIADIIAGTIHSIDNDITLKEEFGDILDKFQGEWHQIDSRYERLIITGKELNFVYESTIGEKEYCDVHTFYFGIDENDNLVVINKYSQTRYTILLGEDNILTITGIAEGSEIRTYEKVSDSTEVPAEKVEPTIGMTESEVYASTWGMPKNVNRTTTETGEEEQWVYESGYIYFRNGIVTAIQEK